MATFYSQELTGFASLPVVKPNATQYSGNLIVYQASITLASQLVTDTIVYGVVPAGVIYQFGLISTDTSLSTSTIALGITGSTGKYRAAAVLTATNTQALLATPVAAFVNGAGLTAQETQFITIAVATLPAAGNLVIQQYWAQTH